MSTKPSNVFAIALYENEAESEDELAFSKHDLLQVLECDYMGMEGWWLCKLVKSNKMGLAAGNRLKITADEKLIARLCNVGKLSSNKIAYSSSASPNSAIILSNSSSVSSILSSSSLSLSTTSGSAHNSTNLESMLNKMSVQETSTSKINLPNKRPPIKAPLNLAMSLRQASPVIKRNHLDDGDDDDYDYDIPENNRPIANDSATAAVTTAAAATELSSSLVTSSAQLITSDIMSDLRKSISPTIDSGVSTSSLASLNSTPDLPASSTNATSTSTHHATSSNNRLSSESSNSSSSSSSSSAASSDAASTGARQSRFISTLEQLMTMSNATLLHSHLHAFLSNDLKSAKHAHACFHPDLAVFNRFKSIYRQLKDFYFYIDACTKMSAIVDEHDDEFKRRLPHLNELLRQLRELIVEKRLLDYTAESPAASIVILSSDEHSLTKMSSLDSSDDAYQYDYDNSPATMALTAANDYGDYCTIDEEDEDQKEEKDVNSATLKKSSEIGQQIRREVRRVEGDDDEGQQLAVADATVIRLTACDQMLIKFYLKHIEENLAELTSVRHSLVEKLEAEADTTNEQQKPPLPTSTLLNELAHKFAITGHKLVFICDTLQRNLNSTSLKQHLFDASASLCTALKVYMIRLKSPTPPPRNLLLDSIGSVFDCAARFKSIILKHYFKSF